MVNLAAFAVVHCGICSAINDGVACTVNNTVMAAVVCAFQLDAVYKRLTIWSIYNLVVVEIDDRLVQFSSSACLCG